MIAAMSPYVATVPAGTDLTASRVASWIPFDPELEASSRLLIGNPADQVERAVVGGGDVQSFELD